MAKNEGREILKKIRPAEAVAFLQRLVRCNSENPPGNEGEAAALIAAELRSFGCTVELQEIEPGRANVLGRLPGKQKEALLFNGHLDTVKVGNTELWHHDPLGAEIEGGFMYGRGTADMKAGLVAQLFAMKALAQSGLAREKSILFTGVIDEEVFFKGTRALIAGNRLFDCRLGYVSEPSNLKIVLRQKGGIEYVARTHGKYAHSGAAFLGQNAIYRMAHVVCALQDYNEALKRRMSLPVLRYPTVNVGVIHGGTGVTFVPDACEIEFDRQVLPGEDIARVEKEVVRVFERIRKRHRFKVDLIKSQAFNTWEILRSEPVVQSLVAAVEGVMGKKPAFTAVNGYCEVELLAEAGIPSVVFGPGDMHTAHAPEERVSLEELLDATRVYARLAWDFVRPATVREKGTP